MYLDRNNSLGTTLNLTISGKPITEVEIFLVKDLLESHVIYLEVKYGEHRPILDSMHQNLILVKGNRSIMLDIFP